MCRLVRWQYEGDGVWEAWVEYGIVEIAPANIIKLAQKAVANACAQLMHDISDCKPAPLSQALGIKAQQKQKAEVQS
jgi:hypothetical protein